MVSLYQSIRNRLLFALRSVTINTRNRKRLSKEGFSRSFSLISSNCNGAFILHDLHLRFNSPTVNLYIPPRDFVEYLSYLEFYSSCPLSFIDTDDPFPVGYLKRGDKGVKVYFMHFKTREEAKRKWEERSKRIEFNNIFCMMTERDGCTYEDLLAFDQLGLKHKVVFTKQKYPDIKCAAYIPGFENELELGRLSDFIRYGFGKRYYDFFDYTSWLLES